MLCAVNATWAAPRRSAGDRSERFADAIRVGGDEVGMIVEDADLIDLRSLGARGFAGTRDVLAVLTTARIGTVTRQDDREQPA